MSLIVDLAAGHRAETFVYVVARDRMDIYEHLRVSFRDLPEVEVVLDRRRRDRRQREVPHVPERRRGARRNAGVTSVAERGWLLVTGTRATGS
jgi:hypothetical protein